MRRRFVLLAVLVLSLLPGVGWAEHGPEHPTANEVADMMVPCLEGRGHPITRVDIPDVGLIFVQGEHELSLARARDDAARFWYGDDAYWLNGDPILPPLSMRFVHGSGPDNPVAADAMACFDEVYPPR